MKRPYRYIDHTADLGIEVRGSSLTDLFVNVGRAIFETQIAGMIKTEAEKHITLQAESTEDLLLDWCRELLYQFAVEGFIPELYAVSIEDHALDARLRGDRFDPRRHRMKLEIKNATYHQLAIERRANMLHARIIFDV